MTVALRGLARHWRDDALVAQLGHAMVEEKRDICNEMMGTSKAILDAIRADFEQLPPDARSKLLDMLCQSGVETPEYGGGASSSAKETRCINR